MTALQTAALPKQSASLFTILASPTGLARMAAEAEHTDDGHLVEFRTMKVRSILNRSVSKRQLSLEYSINPYRGCEFGCRYCYARYTHEFLAPRDQAPILPPEPPPDAAFADIWPDPSARRTTTNVLTMPPVNPSPLDLRDPEAFERIIFLKQNAAWLLEQELRRIDPSQEIALGTATDPYQPIERRVKITRSILEVFARRSGHRLGIVTKSKLIERDIDLLTEIARRNTLVVHLTITTPDARLARILEPRAPSPDLRFAAVRRLRDAGITTGILCSPLLPGITDCEEAIDGMARRAAAAGASFFAASPLFLKPCSRPTYLAFVREHFPALLPEYARRFGGADFAAPAYRRQLSEIVARACRKYGIAQRSQDALLTRGFNTMAGRRTVGLDPKPPQQATLTGQQRLFA
jgi:DNA repair photolyase